MPCGQNSSAVIFPFRSVVSSVIFPDDGEMHFWAVSFISVSKDAWLTLMQKPCENDNLKCTPQSRIIIYAAYGIRRFTGVRDVPAGEKSVSRDKDDDDGVKGAFAADVVFVACTEAESFAVVFIGKIHRHRRACREGRVQQMSERRLFAVGDKAGTQSDAVHVPRFGDAMFAVKEPAPDASYDGGIGFDFGILFGIDFMKNGCKKRSREPS
jgi:hypothetical protein